MTEGEYTDCVTPNRPFLIAVDEANHRAVIFRPRCKLWTCPFCAQVNRSLWAMRAMNGTRELMDTGAQVDFLTITSHELLSPLKTLEVFPDAWKKLSQRARRASGGFEYILIPEQHEDGRLHAHAIETSHLGSTWWIKNARQCGLGYEDEEKPLKTPGGAAHYVTKYISKGLQVLQWPKGFRRVRVSHRWPPLPPLPPVPGWEFRVVPRQDQINELWFHYHVEGYEVKVLGSKEAWLFVQADTDPGL